MAGRRIGGWAAAAATAVTVLGVGGGAVASGTTAGATHPSRPAGTVVAPYVDMGAPELFPTALAAIRRAHLRELSAGFVTSRTGCTPRWDDGRPVSSDRRQRRFLASARRAGATPIVSFGGQMNPPTHDLAQTCHSVTELAAAYAGVARRLRTSRLDFDVEGARLDQSRSVARRAKSWRLLERHHPGLFISLTVPVAPNGLPAGVRRVLAAARRQHVRVDLLNLMTMDYGGRHEMAATAEQSARRSLPQLRRYYPEATWPSIGITPMIGRNDVAAEVFSLADAHRIAAFARQRRVGRLAFWALGRDVACRDEATTARYDCSGVDQMPYEFSVRFAAAAR